MRVSNLTILIYLALLQIVGCAPNDLDGPNPDDVFVKFYGVGSNEAIDIETTSTGEILILAQNDQDDNSNFYLIKTDASGNLIDSRIIDLNNQSNDTPTKLRAISNDRFLLAGFFTFRDSETGVEQYTSAWGIIDSDLELVSTDSVGSPGFNFIDSLQIYDVVQTSDANPTYVVLGQSSVKSRRYSGDVTPAGDDQIYMGKYDDNDSIYWEKSHGFTGNETALSIFEIDNGGFLVVGTTRAASTDGYLGTNIYVFSTNRYGTSDEAALITGIPGAKIDANEEVFCVKKSSLGYSIVGSTESEGTNEKLGFHLAVTSGGKLVDNSTNILENDYNLECEARTFTRTLSNELMVLGRIEEFTISQGDGTAIEQKQDEIMVMKVSPIAGHIEGFDQHYGTTIGNDRADAAITLPDGDVLVATTVDFGSGTTMVGLLRLNSDGELKD